MSDNALREMIAAFAAGCMDKENFVQFKDYLTAGGELPERELGELQNIVSMIPIILDMEKPDPALKDSVAKKLIGLQEEIKTKIRESRTRTVVLNAPPPAKKTGTKTFMETIAGTKTSVRKPTFTNGDNSKTTAERTTVVEREELTTAQTGTVQMPSARVTGQPKSLFLSQPPQQQTPPQPQEKISSGIAGWLAIILVIVLCTLLGYYTYTSISELNSQIDEMKHDITSLRSELASANNFMSSYISLIEFFNYKDVSVANLSSAGPDKKGSARIFLAFDQKEGLVQFKNTILLQPNQGFQIWVVSKNQAYSIGVYTPNGGEYFKLTTFPFLPREAIDLIKITIESNTGSPTPSVQTYLQGTVGK
ncbi:MAG: anti-sigma factor [Ignavibacteriales bacterium]|nr:anti-sigma factor [Ignavibacteriales bacterium]